MDYLTHTRNNHSYNAERIEVPDGIPAIVSKEDYAEVQSILDARMYKHKLRVKANYLLSGKIVCGECGRAYAGNRNKLRSGKIHYSYRCDSRKNKVGVTCDNKSILRDPLEKAVLKQLSKIIFNKSLIPRLLERYNDALAKIGTETNKELARLSAELGGITKAITNIVNAIALSNSTALISRLAELETQKAQLEARRDTVQEQCSIQKMDIDKMNALVETARSLFEQQDFVANRQLIDTFIDKVVVYADHVEIVLNAAPFIYNGNYGIFTQSIDK